VTYRVVFRPTPKKKPAPRGGGTKRSSLGLASGSRTRLTRPSSGSGRTLRRFLWFMVKSVARLCADFPSGSNFGCLPATLSSLLLSTDADIHANGSRVGNRVNAINYSE